MGLVAHWRSIGCDLGLGAGLRAARGHCVGIPVLFSTQVPQSQEKKTSRERGRVGSLVPKASVTFQFSALVAAPCPLFAKVRGKQPPSWERGFGTLLSDDIIHHDLRHGLLRKTNQGPPAGMELLIRRALGVA